MEGRARIGARVLVRFGNQKVTGVVVPPVSKPPVGIKLVELSDVLDDEPSLSHELVDLCLWVADYYEAPPGEVMRAALPAGSGVAAQQLVSLTDAGRASLAGDGSALPAKLHALLARIGDSAMPMAGQTAAIRQSLVALRERGLVEDHEKRDARVRLKRERVAVVTGDVGVARAAFARAPKKLAALDALVGAGGTLAVAALNKFVGGVAAQLVKLGVVAIEDREVALDAAVIGDAMPGGGIPEPTAEQAVAVAEITAAMTVEQAERKPFLLHGVTGSGKTEVYLRVIAAALERGKTALVLVPEISLTPQLAARFRARFGDQVAILHSGLKEQARLGEWSRLHRGEAKIAVGARSAVFAPLTNIGVIVVDEEHDASFKQDEGVRYHGRDVALVRAQRAGAVCVLGSATPSLESYAHAERGAYRLLVLTQRPTARPMPAVEIVDLRVHLPDGDAFLSAPLRQAIGETMAAGNQAILFLNRRGFATFVLCKSCGHAFRCPRCSVSLTYHRNTDRLDCHYCEFRQRIPETCPSCGGKDSIIRKGLGTEKIADAVAAEFPTARVARLDRDVATGAKVEVVLSRVARREIDILVGTQMVTKGHDFPGVTLVGVLCADTGLNIPDFRASERTFQLLAQVAGRAGRGDLTGRVIIQTYRPTSAAVTCAAAHDYESFFAAESEERKELMYPPHGRLIAVRIDGPDEQKVASHSTRIANIAETLAKQLGGTVEVRGAVPAPIEKLRDRTRWQIWLRGTDRAALRKVARSVLAVEAPPKVRVGLDVDPISAL
jgi:primosomal protein N' (replication factor Y)